MITETNSQASIFKRGSTTFFTSSLFFPKKAREQVTTLYAFVRTADDFVDSIPQAKQNFLNFKRQYYTTIKKGGKCNFSVISNFIVLQQTAQFSQEWVDAFLHSMEMDLHKKSYQDFVELDEYLYGSSEVIGLMMAKIMQLPNESLPYARQLGKAFQYINFIRDIAEDWDLGRTYIPQSELARYNLKTIDPSVAKAEPEKFAYLLRRQLDIFEQWLKEAEKGFHFLPRHARIPIKTATAMYRYTAKKIMQNPLIVLRNKVKPHKLRILAQAISYFLTER